MSRRLQVDITETVEELKQLMNAQQKAKFRERLQALYLLKTGQAKSLQGLADYSGRAKSTIMVWLMRYRTKGVASLVEWNYKGGKKPTLSGAVLQALRDRLSQAQGFRHYSEIQHWLKDEYGLDVSYKTLHKTVRYKLKAKLKVARPSSLHRVEEAVVEFKKNCRNA